VREALSAWAAWQAARRAWRRMVAVGAPPHSQRTLRPRTIACTLSFDRRSPRGRAHALLPPGPSRHVQVLRLQPGAAVTLFDGPRRRMARAHRTAIGPQRTCSSTSARTMRSSESWRAA
jgi:hypothetical protein